SAPAPVRGAVRLVFGDGRVFAETGCNTVRGPVTVADGALVADALMSTRMACEPALMEQERWVTEMLTSRPRLELSGPYLALHWGEGEQWWLGLDRDPATAPAS
ncbi:MAG TPA: META domain-containing protein, partial [Ornithinibacter sp.]|nr:META domain-containing protein [Ornithinibacter sp.]